MKHLKIFENFNSDEKIHEICRKYNIENYTINPDGSIDVDGDVDISNRGLTKIPLKFRKVSGNFYCHNNKLTSLEGAPTSVGGDFYCSYNQLTSLEGAPTSVGGGFYCHNNKLTSLEGAPTSVGGDFYCSYNRLTSLEGSPTSVSGYFDCDDNPVYEVWKLFGDKDEIELLNECDIFREIDGNPAIILDRLNSFLEDIGKESVTKVKGYISV